MAKTLDLRQYQEDILARIKDLSRTGDAGARSRLGIRAGSQRLLVSLEDISEVLPVPEIHAVPLSKPWFLGIANVRGNLYGISDLAAFSGQPESKRTASCRVLLVHPKYKAHAGLLVEGILGLRMLDRMREQETRATPLPGRREFQDEAGQSWYEIDIQGLLATPEFLKAGLA